MILAVLKVVGIILLCIIGFILLLLLLVLLAPVSYRIEYSYAGSDFWLKIKVSWLAVFRAYAQMLEGKFAYKVKALFITVINSDKSSEKKPEKTADKAIGENTDSDKNTDSGMTESLTPDSGDNSGNDSDNNSGVNSETVNEENVNEEATEVKKDNSLKTIFNKIKLFLSKIKHPADIYDMIVRKWMDFTGRIDRICDEITNPNNREVVILVLGQVKTLFRHIKPRKHKFYLKAGFSDPSLTGRILGAYAVINSILRLNFILEPEFDREVLESAGFVKGRIRILNLLIILIKLYSNKTIRKWIRRK